jgi:hypothetical protein
MKLKNIKKYLYPFLPFIYLICVGILIIQNHEFLSKELQEYSEGDLIIKLMGIFFFGALLLAPIGIIQEFQKNQKNSKQSKVNALFVKNIINGVWKFQIEKREEQSLYLFTKITTDYYKWIVVDDSIPIQTESYHSGFKLSDQHESEALAKENIDLFITDNFLSATTVKTIESKEYNFKDKIKAEERPWLNKKNSNNQTCKTINRNHPIVNSYQEIFNAESHHSHEIIEDENAIVRWKPNLKIKKYYENISLNDLLPLLDAIGYGKNSEVYRKLYRDIGFSLSSYSDVFYEPVNNDVNNYKPYLKLDRINFQNIKSCRVNPDKILNSENLKEFEASLLTIINFLRTMRVNGYFGDSPQRVIDLDLQEQALTDLSNISEFVDYYTSKN